jgi:cellobiose phosphorylase
MTLTTRPDAHHKLAENRYGYFRDNGREYVITDLATPMPWVNVMSNGAYGLVVSQAGSGFSWGDNCQTSRITRWDQDLVQDRQGRFIYIQDVDVAQNVWSTTLQPTLARADDDAVVHGLGYTTYSRTCGGIRSSHTIFVPRKDACEVWLVNLVNTGSSRRRLRLATYLEWHLGNSTDWHREFHRLFYESGQDKNFIHVRKLPGLRPDSRVIEELHPLAFFGAQGLKVEQWIADKASFLGKPADATNPGILHGHQPEKANPRWNDPIASCIGTIELEPGESKWVTFVVGSVEDAAAASELVERYTPEEAKKELAAVRSQWTEFCERSRVETGDEAFDLMNNYWLKYQTYGCRMVARCAYYQQGGAYGFRDQLQDSLGMMTLDTEITRQQIIRHAEAMYDDGGVRHWWHPNTEIAVESHHSDTSLWVPYATLAYIEETNDLGILQTDCRYLDHTTQDFKGSGTLLEHILKGIDRTLAKMSPRGVPLILSGDWNDGLSHAGVEGRGESFWLGMFLFDVLRRWAPLLDECGMPDKAKHYAQQAEALRTAVNSFGWDGNWYLQGTRDDGKLLGSSSCQEGSIFLNPQTWSVISGIAPADRSATALSSARDQLVKPYGALLLAPAFSKVDPYVGYITRYAPGLRENGGVYSHASTWMIQALAMAGFQDEARALYHNMLPCNGRDPDLYVAEPYVMPGNIDGPDSPFEGRAGWTWYTGSSAWMYRVALDWICGVRGTRGGLLIEPKSGSRPLAYKLTRKFRGDTFEIEVSGTGEKAHIHCDTAKSVNGLLQSSGTGALHHVKVQLS